MCIISYIKLQIKWDLLCLYFSLIFFLEEFSLQRLNSRIPFNSTRAQLALLHVKNFYGIYIIMLMCNLNLLSLTKRARK